MKAILKVPCTAAAVIVFLAGCVVHAHCQEAQYVPPATPPVYYPAMPSRPPAQPVYHLSTAAQTAEIENQDRKNRFDRLASRYNVVPPRVFTDTAPAGTVAAFDYPVPVVRVVFSETVLFDYKKQELQPEANAILEVIAENMKRDLPDVALTIVGHTDAIGGDVYNDNLSLRRAQAVIQGLVNLGVRPAQLSALAMGKRQPIASNLSDNGRARNRRVEFVISASQAANIQIVRRQPIIRVWLNAKLTDPSPSHLSQTVKLVQAVKLTTPYPPYHRPTISSKSLWPSPLDQDSNQPAVNPSEPPAEPPPAISLGEPKAIKLESPIELQQVTPDVKARIIKEEPDGKFPDLQELSPVEQQQLLRW